MGTDNFKFIAKQAIQAKMTAAAIEDMMDQREGEAALQRANEAIRQMQEEDKKRELETKEEALRRIKAMKEDRKRKAADIYATEQKALANASRHKNPDGSTGGYLVEGAIVGQSVHLDPEVKIVDPHARIDGEVKILGNTTLGRIDGFEGIYIKGDNVIMRNVFAANSVIICGDNVTIEDYREGEGKPLALCGNNFEVHGDQMFNYGLKEVVSAFNANELEGLAWINKDVESVATIPFKEMVRQGILDQSEEKHYQVLVDAAEKTKKIKSLAKRIQSAHLGIELRSAYEIRFKDIVIIYEEDEHERGFVLLPEQGYDSYKAIGDLVKDNAADIEFSIDYIGKNGQLGDTPAYFTEAEVVEYLGKCDEYEQKNKELQQSKETIAQWEEKTASLMGWTSVEFTYRSDVSHGAVPLDAISGKAQSFTGILEVGLIVTSIATAEDKNPSPTRAWGKYMLEIKNGSLRSIKRNKMPSLLLIGALMVLVSIVAFPIILHQGIGSWAVVVVALMGCIGGFMIKGGCPIQRHVNDAFDITCMIVEQIELGTMTKDKKDEFAKLLDKKHELGLITEDEYVKAKKLLIAE